MRAERHEQLRRPVDAPRGRRPVAHALGSRSARAVLRPEFGAFVGTVLIYLFFVAAAGGSGFVTLNGTASWLNVAAELGIVALPLSLLMIAGEFDLSIGSIIAGSSLVVSIAVTRYGVPLGAAVALALALAGLVGLLNGIVTVKTGLPSFIVTLATYLSVAGLTLGFARLLTGTTQVSLEASGPLHDAFTVTVGQFGIAIVWWLALAILASWILTRTRFGNWVLATGGDLETARSAGVPIHRVKVLLFVGTAMGAALLGVLQTMEYNGGDASRGQSYVFNSIIAVVIGGVLLHGGYGSAVGVCFGAMTYGLVSIGVFYTGWNTDWVQLFLGVLLLAAVLGNNFFRKLATRAR